MSGSLAGTIANVFRQDAFSNVALSKLVQRNPYNPVGIGALDLFDPLPIRTKAVAVEQLQGKLIVVPTSARGSPPVERVTEKRQARYFGVPRLAHADTLYYEELQDIRDYEDQTVFMQVQREVARRLSGPTGLQANMEYTRERLRLGAIQGILRDADDTIIFNWFAEFGITPPAEIVLNLMAETVGSLRPLISTIKRGMMRASGGAITMNTPIMACCGDKFWGRVDQSRRCPPDLLELHRSGDAARGERFRQRAALRHHVVQLSRLRRHDHNRRAEQQGAVLSEGAGYLPGSDGARRVHAVDQHARREGIRLELRGRAAPRLATVRGVRLPAVHLHPPGSAVDRNDGCDRRLKAGARSPKTPILKVRTMADDIIEEPAPVLEPTPPSKPAITMPADPNTLPVRQLKTLREFTAPATPPAIRARTFTVGSVINGADFAGPYIEEMVRQGYHRLDRQHRSACRCEVHGQDAQDQVSLDRL